MNTYKLPKKRVAVLMATYNGERFLQKQLESLCQQTFLDFCCYIHDDGSNDRTIEIVRDFCTAYPEKFVLIEAPKCGGAKQNFMFLLSAIQADYYMFCDQDDEWLPTKIEDTINVIINEDQNFPTCVHTDLSLIDENGNEIAKSYYIYTGKNPKKNSIVDLLKSNTVVGCTLAINREMRDAALSYHNLDLIYMHDWWIALLAACEGKLIYLPKPLIKYRQHGNNTVGAQKHKSYLDKIIKNMDVKRAHEQRSFRNMRMRNFAKELAQVLNDTNKNYQLLNKLGKIESVSKLKRIKFYMLNELFTDESPVLWQMIWI